MREAAPNAARSGLVCAAIWLGLCAASVNPASLTRAAAAASERLDLYGVLCCVGGRLWILSVFVLDITCILVKFVEACC